jgi:hypothetical protein
LSVLCRFFACVALFVALAACKPVAPGGSGGILPSADFQPPSLVEAGPVDARSFVVRFDEDIAPVAGSFGLEPSSDAPSPSAEGRELRLAFADEALPGGDYHLAGEVEDARGNRTRFVLDFVGYNAHPARLAISELQAQKNSSTKAPHRDFVEFQVLEAGNLGGLELSWASGTKLMSCRLPAAEAVAGDYVVLHLAPEGIPAEVDETGSDLSASGGVDSSPEGRDLWSAAGGLPDESAALALRSRPGGALQDALFYSSLSKTGPLPDGKLADLVKAIADGGGWVLAGEPAWEDGFRWSPSAARSIVRNEGADTGSAADFHVSASGAQSPGLRNPPP